MLKTISKNIFSNYVGIAGAIIIAFMLSPFLVHSLGDTRYGVWSVVSALTGYMALLDLGVSSAMAKYVSKFKALKDYRSLNQVLASGLVIMLSAGTILLLLSPLLASAVVSFFKFDGQLGESVRLLVIVGSVDIAIFVSTGILVGAFFGFQRYEIINAVNLLVAIFKAILFYLVLTNGYDLVAMGLVSLAGNIMAACALYIAIKKVEPQVDIKLSNSSRKTLRSIFNFSKFTFLSMVAMQLVYYSDAFVIGYFLSAAAITYYTIPWSLGEYTNKLTLAIAQTFVPVFSEQDATTGDKAIYSTYVTGTKFMLTVSNLLCIGMLAVGDYFVALWMGPTYAEKCSVILAIMFFTQLIKGPQLLSYSILLGTARHKLFSYFNIGFSFLNLILSIILIQRYGLVGVAVATAFTQISFYGVITPILTSRVIGSNLIAYFKDTYLRIVPSSLLLYLALVYLANYSTPDSYFSLLTQALCATTIYLVSIYWVLLNGSEREFISSRVGDFIGRLNKSRA